MSGKTLYPCDPITNKIQLTQTMCTFMQKNNRGQNYWMVMPDTGGIFPLTFLFFGSLTKLLGRCTTAKLCGWTFCMLLQFVLDCLPSRFIHNCSAEWPEKMLGTIWQSDIRCCIYFETKKKWSSLHWIFRYALIAPGESRSSRMLLSQLVY